MKKVIMILTNRYDPDVRVYKEAKYLVDKGYDVEILCWDREGNYLNQENEVIENIKIKRFYPPSKYGSGIKQIIPFIKFLREVKKYLKNVEFDYLHCHDLDGAVIGANVSNNYAKTVFDMHEYYEIQDSKQKIKKIIKILVKYIQDKFDYIVYVNQIQTKTVSENNKNKLVFLPNYPETENYVSLKKAKSNFLRVSYIGAVRQYSELKNLMEAAKDFEQLKISINGEGVAYKKLNEIKKNYENVEVTGVFNYNQVGELYSNTDVLYAVYPIKNPQNQIAYPVKYFEAIASKTPIIVSKGTILEEEINKYKIGFVVDPNDINGLQLILNNIIENPDTLKVMQQNIEKIQKNFQWTSVVDNLNKIYQ